MLMMLMDGQDATTSFKMEEEVSASLADPFVAGLRLALQKIAGIGGRTSLGNHGKTIGKLWLNGI